MKLVVSPGTYVVAVSGGVDSMVLLNLLAQPVDSGIVASSDSTNYPTIPLSHYPTTKLIVAHFDHGIREDSVEDRRLVQTAAEFYGLPFVYNQGNLGPKTSEASARQARYDFLHHVRRAAGARAIITAHHQDDALETAILNMLRGTTARGLGAMAERHDHLRPLMVTAKDEIRRYAQDRDLIWREDSTNSDQNYTRNYIRWQIMPRLDAEARQQLWRHIQAAAVRNRAIDDTVATSLHLQSHGGRLDRNWFNHLPHAVAREIMAGWLRAQGLRDFDRPKLERLVIAAKTARPGKRFDVFNGRQVLLSKHYLALVGAER